MYGNDFGQRDGLAGKRPGGGKLIQSSVKTYGDGLAETERCHFMQSVKGGRLII